MDLIQFHLFRVGACLMIVLAVFIDYADICVIYYKCVGFLTAYFYMRYYYYELRQNIENIYAVRVLAYTLAVVLMFVARCLSDFTDTGNVVFNYIFLSLCAMWNSYILYLFKDIHLAYKNVSELSDIDFIRTDLHLSYERALRIGTLTFLNLGLIVFFLFLDFLQLDVFGIPFKVAVIMILLGTALLIVELAMATYPSLRKICSSLRNHAICFCLVSVSIYGTYYTTEHTKSVHQYRTKDEFTDFVFLCVNFKYLLSFAWDEFLVYIRHRTYMYHQIWMLYRTIWKFLKYLVFVFVSAGIITCLGWVAAYLFSGQVDPKLHITYCDSGVNRVLYKARFNEVLIDRHLNEDVKFNCHGNVPSDAFSISTIWNHNDTLLKLTRSERIHLSENGLVLSIYLVDYIDYGVYECITEFSILEPVSISERGKMVNKISEHYSNRIFRLKPPTQSLIEYFYVDRGALIYFITYFIVAEKSEVSVKYEVNGVDLHDICTLDVMSCSPMSYIVSNSFKPVFQNRVKIQYYNFTTYVMYAIEMKTCSCSSMNGLHEITVSRELYNKTLKRNTIVEHAHPIKYYFFPKNNDTLINKELYNNNMSFSIIRSLLNATDEFVIPALFGFSELKLNTLFIINLLVFSMLGCLITLVLWFFKYLVYLYCSITIAPFRNLILFGSFLVPCPPSRTNTTFEGLEARIEIQYDVYVSSCEEDFDSAMLIVRFVEEVCRLKVCFPRRDLDHEAGISCFVSFARAIQQSRKCVVVLSKNYIEDEMCRNGELMFSIVPLLHSPWREGHDLVLLKLDRDIEIPVQISYDPDVAIISYTKDDDLIEANRKLRRVLLVD